jgi:hypothetical protein
MPARPHVAIRRVCLALLLLLTVLGVAAVVPRDARASVARGIADPTLTQAGTRMDPAVQQEALDQIGPGLRASYVRYVVSWADAEPTQDAYDETYLAGVDNAINLAKARGVKVIITFAYVPAWASDSTFWSVQGYDRKYAMKTDAATLSAFQTFCRTMASRWQGVWGYECWNEPNLHFTLYPQSTSKDKDFGAHVYIKMLKKFSVGIRQGDPQAKRLAGGTAPRGFKATDKLRDRRTMTSPQRFAAAIKAAKITSYFDGYSHHAYTPGASAKNWPEAAPRDPTRIVNLQNMPVLLKMFPSKPFYLTEYGYQTAPCYSFSKQYVSFAQQADYLKRAYAYAARFPQVKLLMWFLLDDFPPVGNDTFTGFYTGLRLASTEKKPSWFAFARGNHLTFEAPSSGSKGATVTATGTLSSDTAGSLGTPALVAGAQLTVMRRLVGGTVWTKVATARTGADGTYSVNLALTRSADFRVEWAGVVTGPVRRIVAH